MRNKPGIHGLCITVDFFDLRCESVTYIASYTLVSLVSLVLTILKYIDSFLYYGKLDEMHAMYQLWKMSHNR